MLSRYPLNRYLFFRYIRSLSVITRDHKKRHFVVYPLLLLTDTRAFIFYENDTICIFRLPKLPLRVDLLRLKSLSFSLSLSRLYKYSTIAIADPRR